MNVFEEIFVQYLTFICIKSKPCCVRKIEGKANTHTKEELCVEWTAISVAVLNDQQWKTQQFSTKCCVNSLNVEEIFNTVRQVVAGVNWKKLRKGFREQNSSMKFLSIR